MICNKSRYGIMCVVIIKTDYTNPDVSVCQQAASVLRNGGIVVYPTDTAYGIGVNAVDKNALRTLYHIKHRDQIKPTHVVVRDWEMIEKIAHTNAQSQIIFDKYMPGAVTMVLPKREIIPDELTGELATIGVRIPDTKFTKMLSKLVDFPYTTPSANRSGEPTPYSIPDVAKVLDLSKVDLVIDAGVLPNKLPSTIAAVGDDSITILRQGPVVVN